MALAYQLEVMLLFVVEIVVCWKMVFDLGLPQVCVSEKGEQVSLHCLFIFQLILNCCDLDGLGPFTELQFSHFIIVVESG